MKVGLSLVLGILAVLFTSLAAPQAWAHGSGDGGGGGSGCAHEHGQFGLTLSVYSLAQLANLLPGQEPKAHCSSLPAVGDVVLVFDLSLALRKVPIAILVEDRSGAAPRTLIDVPPQTYPTRVASVEARLEKPGRYTATVYIEESASLGSHVSSVPHRHRDVMRFPVAVALGGGFSFGETALKALPFLFLALLIVGGVGYAAYPFIAKRSKSAR